jgi:hypothetical protein
MATNPFHGKPINELLELLEAQEPGSIRHEQLKMELTIQNARQVTTSVEHLRESFEKNAQSNDRLSNKLYWLNVILTAATVLGTCAAIFQVWK